MTYFSASSIKIERICLDSSPKPNGNLRRLALHCEGWTKRPDLSTITASPFVKIVEIKHDDGRRRTAFTVEPVLNVQGTGFVLDKNDTNAGIAITVGVVTNHRLMEHDLLAELLGRSEDPVKLLAYQRILSKENNIVGDRDEWDRFLKDQPLKQITDPDHPKQWNCGAAASQFGQSFFGGSHFTTERNRYYKPFQAKAGSRNLMSDIKFDENSLEKGRRAIVGGLKKRIAERVFCVHHDGFSVQAGGIVASGMTHYLTIIGSSFSEDTFLVTDPWPGGSRLSYTSGIFGDVDSSFIGLLSVRSNNLGIFTSEFQPLAAHKYLVLSGP